MPPDDQLVFMTRKRSWLISRSSKYSKPTLGVYMAMDDYLVEVFSKGIEMSIENRYQLNLITNRNASYLTGNIELNGFKIFIINMTRLIFPDVKWFEDPMAHLERGLSVVTYLRDTYKMPIIVLCGWGKEKLTEETAIKRGASYFFLIPVTYAKFIFAFKKCLENA